MRAWVLLFIFLLGCQPALQATPTSEIEQPAQETQQETDSCASVLCKPDEVCKGGVCGCPSDMKKCGDACISELSCCTDADCGEGHCASGTCITTCAFGEEFVNDECQCTSERKYCEEQDKCIPRNSCCIHTQCERNERCVPTNLRTHLCFEFGDKKICRLLADNERSELVDIGNQSFRAQALDFFSDGSVEFLVDNETRSLTPNKPFVLRGVSIFSEEGDEVGGFCKADEED